jgi:hypothetical protein
VRVNTIVVLNDLGYYARLTCAFSLDDLDCLAQLEALSNLESSCLDLKWFGLVSHEGHVPIEDVSDEALA